MLAYPSQTDNNIRRQANDFSWDKKYKESAKMYLKLCDREYCFLADLVFLNEAVSHYVETTSKNATDFNFKEINLIWNSCQAVLNTQAFYDNVQNKQLLAHLNLNSKDFSNIARKIKKISDCAKLLLFSKRDENSLLTQELIPDIVNHINQFLVQFQLMNMEKPIDISRNSTGHSIPLSSV